MGVDFIRKVGRTFEKHLDVHRNKLGTADLFTRAPTENRCSFPVDTLGHTKLTRGKELVVELHNGKLILKDVLTVVGETSLPPAEIVAAVEQSCGVATAVVQELHEIAGVVEVTLC